MTILIVTHQLPIVLDVDTTMMLLGTHTFLHGTVDKISASPVFRPWLYRTAGNT